MKQRFYRVKQSNFLWQEGAIISRNVADGDELYAPISDLWDTTEHNDGEGISQDIIEKNPEWFERVYRVKKGSKTIYETKANALELVKKGASTEEDKSKSTDEDDQEDF